MSRFLSELTGGIFTMFLFSGIGFLVGWNYHTYNTQVWLVKSGLAEWKCNEYGHRRCVLTPQN